MHCYITLQWIFAILILWMRNSSMAGLNRLQCAIRLFMWDQLHKISRQDSNTVPWTQFSAVANVSISFSPCILQWGPMIPVPTIPYKLSSNLYINCRHSAFQVLLGSCTHFIVLLYDYFYIPNYIATIHILCNRQK